MTTEQWALVATFASILVWPAWRGLVELFWRGVDRWASEPVLPPALDESETQVHGPALTDAALTDTLNAHARAAAGHPYIDHATCEGLLCDTVICACPLSNAGITCPGTVEQACAHHSLLCSDCATTECTDCRIDAGGMW